MTYMSRRKAAYFRDKQSHEWRWLGTDTDQTKLEMTALNMWMSRNGNENLVPVEVKVVDEVADREGKWLQAAVLFYKSWR
jgi:hypothetical protein